MGIMVVHGRLRVCAAVAVLALPGAFVSAAAAPPDTAANPSPCARFALEGLLPGMTDADVRRVMGDGGSLSDVTDPAAGEISVRTYGPLASSASVVFDRRIGRGEDARVVRVRVGFPSTRPNLDSLEARMGPPAAGGDGLAPGLPSGPVVWIDRGCGLALTAFRRQESWWSGDVGTFLQVEPIENAERAGSPGAEAIASAPEPPELRLQLKSEPPPTVPATAPASPPASPPAAASRAGAPQDVTPARRVRYVAPIYPPIARALHAVGHVRLSIVVRTDGSVGNVRVLEATPAGRGFETAATAAVKRWRYDPATRDGRPVASEQVVVLEFR